MQDEAMGGGSEGADTAGYFLGSELQAKSRADVARVGAMAGDGNSEGLMVSGRQQGGLCTAAISEGLRRHAGFWNQSSGSSLGLVGVGRRSGHNNCAARWVQARRRMEVRRPGQRRWLRGPGTGGPASRTKNLFAKSSPPTQ